MRYFFQFLLLTNLAYFIGHSSIQNIKTTTGRKAIKKKQENLGVWSGAKLTMFLIDR